MLYRSILAIALLLTLAAPPLTPAARAQGDPTLQIPFIRLQNSNAVKFPEVDTFGSLVSVGANAQRDQAYLYEKSDTATAFAGPRDLGTTSGDPDLSTATVAYGPDGTLYYVWSEFNARRIYIRVRLPGQDFGPAYTVTGSSYFPAEPDVAVSDINGTPAIFVFWRESVGEVRYRFSTTGGTSWSGTGTIYDRGAFREISAYGAPGGRVAVGYTAPGGESGDLQAYVSFWNGQAFRRERISTGAGNFGEPTVALMPDGNYAAVYRGIDFQGNWGLYVATRNPDGTWNTTAPFGRIARGDTGSVWVDVDPQGAWHILWSGVPATTGRLNVYYVMRRADGTFSTVVPSGGGGTVFNVSGAINQRDRVYTHAVYERFESDDSNLLYSMFSAPTGLVNADAIVIEQGAEFTSKTSVRVDFANPTGNPTQVRYRWGAPPTGSEAPVAFANPLTVPAPALPDPDGCNNLVLYTQLIGGGSTQRGSNADSIVFDRAVQASASVASTASALDPAFTRTQAVEVTVRSAGECAGLASATVSGGTANVTIPINGAAEASGQATLTAGDGLKTLSAAVSDRAGNDAALPLRITLDQTAPVLGNPGTVTVTPGAEETGIVSVEADGVGVTEANLYGATVTVRYTPAGGGAAVTGQPVVVPLSAMREATPQSGGRYRLAFEFSVASGLPAGAARAGSYELRIGLADKADNRSADFTPGTVSFAQAPTFPRLYLPFLERER